MMVSIALEMSEVARFESTVSAGVPYGKPEQHQHCSVQYSRHAPYVHA